IAKDPRFERLPCVHQGTYADDCIVERHKCFIVATCDRDLKRRIRKVPGVPIMYVTQHKYSIERLPEATIGGGKLHNIQLCQHSCVNDPSSDPFSNASPISPPSSNSQRSISVFSRTGIIVLLSLMVILGVFTPWSGMSQSMFSNSRKVSSLSKWRDYSMAEAASFVTKNGTIIVCAGFFNFTSRRPRHLLQILELGYSVMYNDVDMVWFGDPFCYLEGNHDVYFSDDMAAVKPLNHPHDLPPPGKKGRTYIYAVA
ncbi:hypothetical protein Gorai_018428, partial [Gossypium raimondii]|nr:hypothetical protein [Gossypium raimondii]